MTASVRSTAVSGYGTQTPIVTFGAASVAGDTVILTAADGASLPVSTPAALPTGMGATWTLVHRGTRVAIWVGTNCTAGQTVITATPVGWGGTSVRYVGWLVSGIVDPATSVVATAATPGSVTAGVGPVQTARDGQFVAAVVTGGSSLSSSVVSPRSAAHASMNTWVLYDPGTTGTMDFWSATPVAVEPVPHQVAMEGNPSTAYGGTQIVVGVASAPGSGRLQAEQVQALELQPPGQGRASSMNVEALEVIPPGQGRVTQMQVHALMPTEQVAAAVGGVQVQVLIDALWVVSASDGVTAVQMLHTDGVWRPLYPQL